MQQKTTWMRNLQLGITSFFLILTSACKKSYDRNAEYYFINETNHVITFEKGLEAYNLAPKATYMLLYHYDSGKEINPTTYIPPLMIKSNGTVKISFNNTRCLIATYDSEHSPLNIKNYLNGGKISERTYKFTYTFTEADYNRAVTCP